VLKALMMATFLISSKTIYAVPAKRTLKVPLTAVSH
jgi:hypothetical protein